MSANKILLCGAGFSHNWKAPLACEVAASLLASVGNDASLQSLLKKHHKNFENALSELQRAHKAVPCEELERLQRAISIMFDGINTSLADCQFEFSNDLKYSVAGFLTGFAALFNLNQDLLLELQYGRHVLMASNARKGGFYQPGMKQIHNPLLHPIVDRYKQRWTPAQPPFSEQSGNLQPHYKPHGSSDWHADDGRGLLIMGGDKSALIKEHEVLEWHYQQFMNYLSRPNTHLMVIGYSFSDEHINDAILKAWRARTLTGMFIVDPRGLDVLPETLMEVRIMNVSERPLRETFAGDDFEHRKLVAFMKTE
jgi:hypothetical protein